MHDVVRFDVKSADFLSAFSTLAFLIASWHSVVTC